MTDAKLEATCLPCANTQTREWIAWNDLRPPVPDFFHIRGEVWVANPGVEPMLLVREPQGINPTILLLDLYLCQKDGIWPQVLVWKPVALERKIADPYKEAHIMCGDEVIAKVDVQNAE